MEVNTLRGVPLLLQAPLGTRLVVRYRTHDGGLTDALGELTSRSASGVVITTRRGEVSVSYLGVTAAKPVPPPPPRRTARFPVI